MAGQVLRRRAGLPCQGTPLAPASSPLGQSKLEDGSHPQGRPALGILEGFLHLAGWADSIHSGRNTFQKCFCGRRGVEKSGITNILRESNRYQDRRIQTGDNDKYVANGAPRGERAHAARFLEHLTPSTPPRPSPFLGRHGPRAAAGAAEGLGWESAGGARLCAPESKVNTSQTYVQQVILNTTLTFKKKRKRYCLQR